MGKKTGYKNPLSRSIIIGCLIFTVIICSLMAAVSYVLFREAVMQQYRSHLGDIIALTEARIDAEDLEQCIATETESEEFQNLTEYMDQARVHHNLDSIVLIHPVKDGDNYDVITVLSGLYPEEREGQKQRAIEIPHLGDSIGAMFPPGFCERTYQELQDTHEITFSRSVSEFGDSYNAVKGIYKEDGTPVALLTAGLSLQFIQDTLRRYIFIVAIITCVLSVISTWILVSWLKKRVTGPLGSIEESARAFAEQSMRETDPDLLDFERPDIHTGDELESLTDTLVTMAAEMRAYIKTALSAESKAAQMGELANKDALTGIRNKTAYDEEVQKLEQMIRLGDLNKLGLAMIDLNFLKKINDSYGHDKGNLAIKKLCALVCTIFEHSPVFRVGGDEFIVVLKGSDLENIDSLTKRFEDSLKQMEEDESLEPWEKVSAAMGIAYYDPEGLADLEAVFKAADERMYENKARMKAIRSA